jgi:DNA-directed RNA polymerase specialized sigma24 family protein
MEISGPMPFTSMNVPSANNPTFAPFVASAHDRVLRALVAHHGVDGGSEATADAFAYAWANWDRVSATRNPIGYVFRVGDRLATRRSIKARREPATDPHHFPVGAWLDGDPDTELAELLGGLPPRQRAAVLLVHGFGWSYRMAAETLDLPLTSVTNDVIRGTRALRTLLRADEPLIISTPTIATERTTS